MVLLIGNYPADQQQSMQRFANMMLHGLTTAGKPAELIRPRVVFGRVRFAGAFVAKWLSYVDKFLLFPRELKRRSSGDVELVHICDHSNAMYSGWIERAPVVVTCHDLLAVRGALGEMPDTRASVTGKYLQRWILSSLTKANAIACVSRATRRDAQRLVMQRGGRPRLEVISLGLSYPYKKQERARAGELLSQVPGLSLERPFVLHVGSNARMKNREGVLRIFALTNTSWNGQLVFAGEKLSRQLRSLGKHLGVLDRVVEVEGPGSELLEALYSSALVLLYPSRYEGFGWPIIEAQACGCPVICANREPMSDVGGKAALTFPVENEEAMAKALLRLTNSAEHLHWSEKSLGNAQRFRTQEMIAEYIALYRSLSGSE